MALHPARLARLQVQGRAASSLARALSKLEEELRPSLDQLAYARTLEQKLRQICLKLGGPLKCYGSCTNGTFMQGSDVDLTWLCDERVMAATFGPRTARAPIAKAPPPPPPPPPGPPPGAQAWQAQPPGLQSVPKAAVALSRPPPPPKSPPPPPKSAPPPPTTLAVLGEAERGHSLKVQRFKTLRLLRQEAMRAAIQDVKSVWVVKARVPVLKFFGAGDVVLCDVSVNNTEGLLNSRLVRSFCEAEPMLGPVIRLLKHWARQRKLGDRSTGGFSTYTLVLMAVRAMQSQSAGLSPRKVQQLSGAVPEGDLEIWAQDPGCQTSGELTKALTHFFDFYSQRYALGGVVRCDEESDEANEMQSLQVICPLTHIDVQRSKVEEWKIMSAEITRAAEILSGHLDAAEKLRRIFSASPPPSQAPAPPLSDVERRIEERLNGTPARL